MKTKPMLTMEDVKKIEAERGSCEAWREINRRLMAMQHKAAT